MKRLLALSVGLASLTCVAYADDSAVMTGSGMPPAGQMQMPPPPPRDGNGANIRMGSGEMVIQGRDGRTIRMGSGEMTIEGPNGRTIRMGSGEMMIQGPNGREIRMGSGEMMIQGPNGSGAMMPPPCNETGFAGRWHGSLDADIRTESGSYVGRYVLHNVGADGTGGTADDVTFSGSLVGSLNTDGTLAASFTDAAGNTSELATLSLVGTGELSGSVVFSNVATNVRSVRDCPMMRPMRGSGATIRMGSGEMAIQGPNGREVRMGSGEVRQNGQDRKPKHLLSDAFYEKLDARLDAVATDNREALYEKLIAKLDAMIAALPDGKKKKMLVEIRGHVQNRLDSEFPDNAQSTEDETLDSILSE